MRYLGYRDPSINSKNHLFRLMKRHNIKIKIVDIADPRKDEKALS
ncbi:hypothetical protein [Coprococcus aceti]|jgi:hypothetical protein|nr:hypothetical protein [Coprococcus aceti]